MPDKLALNKKNRGYIMVEALVAITIIVVGLLGIFALLSRSLSLNRVVADRYVGTYLAAEGIEIVKNLIDNNVINGRPWNTGISNGEFEVDYDDLSLGAVTGENLKFDPDTGRYDYSGGEQTRFARIINIELLGGGDEIKANSIVKWISRGEARFETNLEDRFFNWR